VTSSVLALLFGGAGAWAYERFVAPALAEKAPATAARPAEDPGVQKGLTGLDDRFDKLSDQLKGLTDQYKQLQTRVESMPRSAPAPDLGPVEQKVAQFSQQVEALGKKVDPLPQQLAQYEQRLKDLDERLDASRSVSVARTRTAIPPARDQAVNRTDRPSPSPEDSARPDDRPSPAPGERAENAPASSEKNESAGASLEAGRDRFREGHYQEAYDIFKRVLQARPNDARPWYFAALSYGLATGDWGPATQNMVNEGVKQERAGQPPKTEIDSAFAGLTKENGKEWLDFYRHRAQ
jgi:tetratricopeptide (TPR) repeat protein